MVNKVILVGHLGRDPEIRYTQSGQAVANFTMATGERWKDKEGELQERTEWHRIVAWGKLAEFCSNYLGKGRQVFIEGRIQSREWEDKQGEKRRTTEIVAQTIQALGARREAGPANAGDSPSNRFDSTGGDSLPDQDSGGDDIPF